MMKLLDSNIVIYGAKAGFENLRNIFRSDVCVSVITYVEVLGYHAIAKPEQDLLEEFFTNTPALGVTAQIIDYAVKLRCKRRMGLADSLIAGTALASGYTLVTRNTNDFDWVQGLSLLNPFAPASG
jgi:toxin FitB